ncbi:hypothetical protein FocTR4_00001572 [Fusarium oxysporum f. sp. cubense]|uniref:Uncharacterized protein n=1 Tax=Fusarium oxysporum f. sp. cubense TaxID=61366 RepID=A0A5C6T0R3_FUSOC|nr:hypothetical protein FocTR4_00001572 [Fusarium oxysporum f. sp. cubense]
MSPISQHDKFVSPARSSGQPLLLGTCTTNLTDHVLFILTEAKRMGTGGSFANNKLVNMERLVIDVTCLLLGIITHALTLASLESNLEACDITFPVPVSNSPPATFRAIVSSLSELQSSEGKARMARLLLMNGGEHIAVILLLDGYKPMESFSRLQIEYAFTSLACLLPVDLLYRMLCSDCPIPMIPISTTQDFADCLESLRRNCIRKNSAVNTEQRATHKNLVCWCVEGKPLSRDQVNVLTGITSGFRGFADLYSSPGGRATICEYLGDSDGERVVSFLSNGPPQVRKQPGVTYAHNV